MITRTVNGVKAEVVNDNDGDEVILLTDGIELTFIDNPLQVKLLKQFLEGLPAE